MENTASNSNGSDSSSSVVVCQPTTSRSLKVANSTSVPSPENEEQVKETTHLDTKPTGVGVEVAVAVAVAVPGGSKAQAHGSRSVMTQDPGKGKKKKPKNAQDSSHWRGQVDCQLRSDLVDQLLSELQRIAGPTEHQHQQQQKLRTSAANYELLVWQKSTNLIEYRQKMEARIQALQKQPTRQTPSRPDSAQDHKDRITTSGSVTITTTSTTTSMNNSNTSTNSSSPTTRTNPNTRSLAHLNAVTRSPSPRASRKAGKRKMSSSGKASPSMEEIPVRGTKRVRKADGTFATKSSSSSSTTQTNWRGVHDREYFDRLETMRSKYRDEVALVFRELSRVNGVIQHSPHLRPRGAALPNNLSEFLVNLKKIIYLLEQQRDEVCGMIPARKRTLEYLQVVENHIQHKVLPILQRLRATYSSILRPLLLSHLKRFESNDSKRK